MPAQFRGFQFTIPNLPKERYDYLKQVRVTTGLSPWQVVLLALMALEHLAIEDGPLALEYVKEIKERYPKP